MIYVECKPDEALVKQVTHLPRREIAHEQGNSRVCQRLSKVNNCRGVVDEDPGKPKPSYLNSLVAVEDDENNGIRLLRDQRRNNYVVMLRPTLEAWVLRAAAEAGIDVVRAYRLPKDPDGLHGVINTNLDKFNPLLEALVNSHSRRITALRRMLIAR